MDTICYICQEDADRVADKPPCKCGGTISVHSRCIQKWIDHSQSLTCSICKTGYASVPLKYRLMRRCVAWKNADGLIYKSYILSSFALYGYALYLAYSDYSHILTVEKLSWCGILNLFAHIGVQYLVREARRIYGWLAAVE
jgi:hypothetical protein